MKIDELKGCSAVIENRSPRMNRPVLALCGQTPGAYAYGDPPRPPTLVAYKNRVVLRFEWMPYEGRKRWVGDPGIGPVFLVVSTEVAGMSCSLLGSCI